ncbi:hypothetical protein FBU59_002324 [Linderina macrospora]|uniref:Uncharacterized protein n=1 Tax=Linderina macrospora TaxID=4868 RepID=A0ACC1JBN2_9FUNG|nr:hypothetical protein FBU59_002324 [Linderina macrospora]
MPASPPHATNESVEPAVLVSFRPRDASTDFKAHKHAWTELQARSLGIPFVTKYIGAEPTFEESYRRAIRELHDDYDIATLVTGDIEDVGEGFMDRAVGNTGVELVRPLWKRPRMEILELLRIFDISYIVTLTRLEKLPKPVSERLLGSVITKEFLLDQFKWYDENYEPLDLLNTVDLAGEYGEMHSMVRDCPMFSAVVECGGVENKVHETKYGSYMYIEPASLEFLPK